MGAWRSCLTYLTISLPGPHHETHEIQDFLSINPMRARPLFLFSSCRCTSSHLPPVEANHNIYVVVVVSFRAHLLVLQVGDIIEIVGFGSYELV